MVPSPIAADLSQLIKTVLSSSAAIFRGYQTCDCQSQARTKDQLLFLNITILHNIVMASRIVKSPAVQTTAKRQFAAQAAVARSERELVKAEPLKVSTLKNGLNVASIENHSPITTLGVILKVIILADQALILMINIPGWIPK